MAVPTADTSSVQAAVDAETAKGYRGARVDFNENSAYSQETDPMTSPGGIRYNQINIDEYVDPENPMDTDTTPIFGRTGISDPAEAAFDVQTLTIAAPAQATAATGQTTEAPKEIKSDGTITGATFTPTATIVGDATNNRIFKLRNVTAGHPLFKIDTVATKTGGTSYAMVADGGDQSVSIGDELQVIETTGGTGVAHGGASVVATSTEQDA